MKHLDVVIFFDKHSFVIHICHILLIVPIGFIGTFKLVEMINLNRKLELSLGVLGMIGLMSYFSYFLFEYKNKIGYFRNW